MQCQTNDFCEKITPHLQNNDYGWSSIWKNSSTVIEKELKQFFSKNTAFSEPSIANFLEDVDHLFLANSMPIRDADLFLFSEKTTFWANRGVSGIDGNIATVTGLAAALKKPIVALLGDMTALHDINSLALVSQIETPIYFIVINNLGGGIFSFLPISQKEDFCNEFFSINPSYSLTCLSKGFSLSSFSVSSHEELKDVWEKTQGKSCLIECKTDRKENVLHHQMIYERIAKCFTINLTEIADSHLSSSCTAS
jgi:2-succinyl-5-enolpyruvyl-6-hydroxy-3-cyclohexene-1-carboxylate synthase